MSFFFHLRRKRSDSDFVVSTKRIAQDLFPAWHLLTQECGNEVINFISVRRVVKLEIDVGAEVVLGTEHFEPLQEKRDTCG